MQAAGQRYITKRAQPTADVTYRLSMLHVRVHLHHHHHHHVNDLFTVHRDPIKTGTIIRIENQIKGVLNLDRSIQLSEALAPGSGPYLAAFLVVKSNDHDMQHRSLQLVSALRLHSFPEPMSRQRCTALASVRCNHS